MSEEVNLTLNAKNNSKLSTWAPQTTMHSIKDTQGRYHYAKKRSCCLQCSV